MLVLFALFALASGASWRLIDSNVLTTDLGKSMKFVFFLVDSSYLAGVAFTTESLGYTAGDANGKGPVILKTTDGELHNIFNFIFIMFALFFIKASTTDLWVFSLFEAATPLSLATLLLVPMFFFSIAMPPST